MDGVKSPGTPVHTLKEVVAPSTSGAGVVLKMSLLANYFVSPLPFPSPVYNPSILCVWFAAPASPPARGAQTSMRCTDINGLHQLLFNQEHPRKAWWCRGEATVLLSPSQKAKMPPGDTKAPLGSCPHLTQFPHAQTEGSPSISTVTWGDRGHGPAWQAGMSLGQTHPSVGRKSICL